MFKIFYPKECADSTYQIDFKSLYARGYRGVLFDIDNTLVPHGSPADERAVELFAKLRKMGFHTCLISNNKEPRVKPFAEAVDSPYIYDAHKPSGQKLSESDAAHGDGHYQLIICGGSAVYRCFWCKPCGYVYHSGKANPPERRDSDCPQAVPGKNRFMGIS